MKRMMMLALACLVYTAICVASPGLALGSQPAPVTSLRVHYTSGDGTNTVRFRISWAPPEEAGEDTVVVGVHEFPFAWDNPLWYSAGYDPWGRMVFSIFGVKEPVTSVEVSYAPLTVNGDGSHPYDINVWRTRDNATASPEVILWSVTVTSTPQPVQNLSVTGNNFTWQNDQGGPIGTLYITVTQDDSQIATASIDGSAASWPLPALPAGHSYGFAVSRTFEGKTSAVAQTNLVITAQPVPTITGLTGPSSVKHGKWFTIGGRVAPTGTGTLKLQEWLLKKGRWVSQANLYAKVSGNAWHLSVRLKTKGSWRFRAFYPGSGGNKPTLASTSGFKTVKVK